MRLVLEVIHLRENEMAKCDLKNTLAFGSYLGLCTPMLESEFH